MHEADAHDFIRVLGARENNLKNVSVEIPKRRLTVFTGVSGSGKSSLVFDTIAAESQRMINETYPAFVQGFMPSLDRPDVDRLENLTTAIVVGQDRLGANPRSTVGTATDANALLRVLYSQFSRPYVGPPPAFSFNVPSAAGTVTGVVINEGRKGDDVSFESIGGMCPACEGLGRAPEIDLAEVFDEDVSIADGSIKVPGYNPDGWMVSSFAAVVPTDVPIKQFTDEQCHDFLYGETRKVKTNGINVTYQGLIPKLQQTMFSREVESLQPHIRKFVEKAVVFVPCPSCEGTRFAEHARKVTIDGISIADACAMQISELAAWVRSLRGSPALASDAAGDATPGAADAVLDALDDLLDGFVEIGLGYLSLSRSSGSLSGGEAQRTKLVRHLGSALTDVTYVFDEPTVGLHPHDIQRMNRLLERLRDKGNTVLVVEHKPETIQIADHVIDLGPGAGKLGGEITFQGSVAELRASDTKTGRHFGDRAQLKASDALRKPTGAIAVRGANENNLKNVDVDVPLGVLTVVTGVAGSGKSSLIHAEVSPREGIVAIDQAPIRGNRRSSPATYTGMLEHIRKAFAKENGVKPALFSANSEGACPACKGAGEIITQLGYVDTVATRCEVCRGIGFQASVLEYTLGGKNIAEVLAMPVSDAVDFFAKDAKVPAAHKILERLNAVGLGYLAIGQSLSTLSGGERQRLKLALAMGEPGDVYVLDEPTTGLHLADTGVILELLDRLVDSGKSVIVIEHNQAVMAHADHIIDIGPGAGNDGGEVVFEGTPHELIASDTLTGQHLAEYVA